MAGRLLLIPGLFRDDRIFLEEFARGGEEDWALFATRSLMLRWRDGLLRGAAGGVMGGRSLLLFGGLGRRLLGRTAPRPVSKAVRETIMARILARLAREGRLRALGPLAGSPHLAKEVALVHGEFRRGLVPRESLLALAGGEPRLADLALCFAEYERILATAGWSEEEDLLALALRTLGEGRRPPMRSLLVHGFTDFTPLQAAVLRALARSAAVTVLLPDPGAHPGHGELRRNIPAFFPGWEISSHPPTVEAKTGLDRLALGGGAEGPGDGGIQGLVGETPFALAALIARVVRAHLCSGPDLHPGEIAIVRREEKAADGLVDALRRHGLPVEDEEGPPLLALNGVGAILAALDCLARDWPRTSVLRLARGVFVGEEAHLSAVLARASAEAKVVRTKAAWMRLARADSSGEDMVGTALNRLERGLALLPGEGATADYLQALRAFIAYWELPARFRPHEGDERGFAAYAREMRGLARLFTLLEETAAAEEAAAEVLRRDASSFAADLFRLAGENACPAPSPRPLPGIRCLDPSEIRGLRFRLVFLVGLNEGEFPKTIAEDWLLPDEERMKLRGRLHGLEIRRTLLAREWQLLANVIAAAGERLYLCRSELDGRGDEAAPSVFWDFFRERCGDYPSRRLAAGELLPEGPGEAGDGAAAKARLLADLLWHELPQEREGEILAAYEASRAEIAAFLSRGEPRPMDGVRVAPEAAADLRLRFGPERILSTSALEDYAACPFSFFARRLLGLEDEEEPVEEDLGGIELGQAYHAALERFFRRLGDRPLVRGELPVYEGMIAEAAAEAFASLAGKAATEAARRLWAMAEETCRLTLLRLVRSEIRMNERLGARRTIHCELGFGLGERFGLDPASRPDPLILGEGELRLGGKIDRVDLLADGEYAVYDYKLGRVPPTPAILEGKALQIPVYLLAARSLFFPERAAAGAGYYSLRDLSCRSGLWREEFKEAAGIRSRTGADSGEGGWEEILSALIQRVLAAGRGIRAGDFRPLPPEEECPDYCPFGSVCRREAG